MNVASLDASETGVLHEFPRFSVPTVGCEAQNSVDRSSGQLPTLFCTPYCAVVDARNQIYPCLEQSITPSPSRVDAHTTSIERFGQQPISSSTGDETRNRASLIFGQSPISVSAFDEIRNHPGQLPTLVSTRDCAGIENSGESRGSGIDIF